ncbi:MAG TPA: serine/threonine-protein kinase [Kofleriaceae bacterium]
MAGDRSEDELARTATAPGSASDPDAAAPAPELGATLGRYRIERVIGEGGMGVVHAAFDPDLERRVALKVLRVVDSTGDDARQRLLREARAMARLTHPNVVAVHEVGTASGRDYVAMELVEGESLAEWLRAEQRSTRDIVQAFIAAGRGLAAAHAAGLVHRDFKPHNVLRRGDGRVCVTDFGLARGLDATGHEATMRLGKDAKPEHTPSALSGLTATGSVLGTPAYMAPEQWAGGTVGPPADQFAFCVALWEALSGERPFRGATIDLLKAEVARGPASLDASKLPRRLRAVLRRGLDPDPAKRFPNMDALLAALSRAQRKPIAAAVLGALVPVAAIAFFGLRGLGGAPSCELPAHAADDVWPQPAAEALAAAGRAELRGVLDRDIVDWKAARQRACADTGEHHAARLACLDGVLARFDAVHHAIEQVPGELVADSVLPLLVDPTVCDAAVPPRLALTSNADTAAAFAFLLRDDQHDKTLKADDAGAFAARAGLDACAQGYALYAQLDLEDDMPKDRAIASAATTAAETCGDDRLRADLLVMMAPLDFEAPTIGPKGRAAIEKAAAAVARVAQPDLEADVDTLRAKALAADHRWDAALAAAEHAIAGYGARGRLRAQISAAEVENSVHFSRATVADLQAIRTSVARWNHVARKHHFDRTSRGLELSEAYAMLFLGDIMGAHAAIVQDYRPQPHPDVPTQRIDGIVVDDKGAPQAGAIVAAGRSLWIDSVGPLPSFGGADDMRLATSDRDGHFAIADAPMQGGLVAQIGLDRAIAPLSPHSKLVLAHTRRITGKVELGDLPRTKVFVMLVPHDGFERTHHYLAPLQPDGSFEILAAPTGSAEIGVATWGRDFSSDVAFRRLPAGTADVAGLVLPAARTTGRKLTVVVRSSYAVTLDGAQVFLIVGRHSYTKLAQLFADGHGAAKEVAPGQMQLRYAKPLAGEPPPEAVGKARTGDLIATFDGVAAGDVTACAIGFNGDMSDPAVWRAMNSHAEALALRCEVAGADDKLLVVEAPPQKRFD